MQSLKDLITMRELSALYHIINNGEFVFREVMDSLSMSQHRFAIPLNGRIRTTLMHIQCELEHGSPDFPFAYEELHLGFGQTIPQLSTDRLILHIAQSRAFDALPSPSKYKIRNSYNNSPLQRQLMLTSNPRAEYFEPYYGLVVFGPEKNPFSVIQLPGPGFHEIIDYMHIPEVIIEETSFTKDLERKRSVFKERILTAIQKGEIS